jgi:23S rRNA pseudouridine1911/1915/1917 synthase
VNLQKAVVDPQSAGMRLDLFVARYFPDLVKVDGLSRSGIQKWIAAGQVTLNSKPAKSAVRLKVNDVVAIEGALSTSSNVVAEPLALQVIYEDRDCLVIDKAPGMVVHPAAGRTKGTLVNAILHRCPDLEGLGGECRPGIVHRLDKDTSGIMIVAKTAFALQNLARQFKDRSAKKEYLGLVWGKPQATSGVIDRPIGRHRSDRKRMSSIYSLPRKREAVTEWSVEKSFQNKNDTSGLSWVSLLRLRPRTGRTHQIRVHLADLGYPLIGDKIYGRKARTGAPKSIDLSSLNFFWRQALHAERLGILHPRTGAPMEFYAPLAEDMDGLLKALQEPGGGIRAGGVRG